MTPAPFAVIKEKEVEAASPAAWLHKREGPWRNLLQGNGVFYPDRLAA